MDLRHYVCFFHVFSSYEKEDCREYREETSLENRLRVNPQAKQTDKLINNNLRSK